MLNKISNLFNQFRAPRNDEWINYNTNLGTCNSSVANTFFGNQFILDRNTLTDIYLSNGLGKRIVNMVVEDSIRDFVECDEALIKEMLRLKLKQVITHAATFGRLYGGSLLVCFVDDGRELYNPINFNAVKQVVSFRYFDRYQITWTEEDINRDYYSEDYGDPEIYTVMTLRGESFRVHKSRCFRFNGDKVPNYEHIRNQGWDNSVLQDIYTSLRDYGASMSATAEIVQSFVQTVLHIEGLTDMLRSGQEPLVKKRIQGLNRTSSSMSTVALDSLTEKYEKHASSVSGLADLIDRHVERICADKGYPFSKLTGRSPGGLNATGKTDLSNYNSLLESYRSDHLRPCIEWAVNILEHQFIWKLGEKPKDFDWKFRPLETPDFEQEAKINLTIAQTDQIYIDRGGLDANEIAKLRYADGKFNTSIIVDPKVFDTQDTVDEDFTNTESINQDSLEIQETPQTASLYEKLLKRL